MRSELYELVLLLRDLVVFLLISFLCALDILFAHRPVKRSDKEFVPFFPVSFFRLYPFFFALFRLCFFPDISKPLRAFFKSVATVTPADRSLKQLDRLAKLIYIVGIANTYRFIVSLLLALVFKPVFYFLCRGLQKTVLEPGLRNRSQADTRYYRQTADRTF